MRTTLTGGIAVLMATTAAATAGGLDRTGQPIGLIFEEGNYAEFSIGRADPDLTGTDVDQFNGAGVLTVPGGAPTGDVGFGFNQVGAGVKMQINDQLSFALIYEQPWGSDISYPDGDGTFGPDASGSFLLGGTEAFAESDSITGILRYQFDDNWSVHGGLRYQQLEGNIGLQGAAYNNPAFPTSEFDGYSIDLDRDASVGWLAGFAYEIPAIAARVALTYQSEIEHEFDSVEMFPDAPGLAVEGTKESSTPQSVNLDFQTGIAQDTLLLGSIRWADHSVTSLETTPLGALPSVELIDISNSVTYNLGVAHRINENWAASLSFGYEREDSDDLVSPLAPSNGFKSVSVGLQYTMDNIKVSGGIRYTKLGDAFAETGTPDVARAEFEDNDVLSYGIRVGFYF